MVGKLRKKNRNKQKRFPYIEVEGIENRYLDAALLQICGEGVLSHSLDDEFKLLKKAGITTQDLKKKKYSHEELVALVSPHLLESYDFYNFLANMWEDIQVKTLNHFFDGNNGNFTVEEWGAKIRNLIDEGEMPLYAAVNFLRLYKNGELKELIKSLLREEEYIIQFYRETGIKIEGYDIDWESLDDKEDIEDLFNLEEDTEEIVMLGKELLDRAPDDALRLAARIILDISERVSELGEVQEYKKKYELEKEKVATLTVKVDELTQEVKSKDSQIQSLSKENRTLAKTIDTLNSKVEQQQKESGRLGGLLGEVRKEKEELEKANAVLERRVNSLEKDTSSIAEKVEKELKKEFDKKILKMQIAFDEKTNELETQFEELKKLLEEEQAKNETLSAELERMSKELETTKNDLRVVEKERNELAEQLKNAPVNIQEELVDDDDDLLFGFSEEDIEDFVEFDNKPTRN
jgi:myosin heavy subunit